MYLLSEMKMLKSQIKQLNGCPVCFEISWKITLINVFELPTVHMRMNIWKTVMLFAYIFTFDFCNTGKTHLPLGKKSLRMRFPFFLNLVAQNCLLWLFKQTNRDSTANVQGGFKWLSLQASQFRANSLGNFIVMI